MSLAKKRLRVSSSLATICIPAFSRLSSPGNRAASRRRSSRVCLALTLQISRSMVSTALFHASLARAVLGMRHQEQLHPLLGEELEHCARNGAGLGALQDLLLRYAFGDLELLPMLDAPGVDPGFLLGAPVLLGDEGFQLLAQRVEDVHAVLEAVHQLLDHACPCACRAGWSDRTLRSGPPRSRPERPAAGAPDGSSWRRSSCRGWRPSASGSAGAR